MKGFEEIMQIMFASSQEYSHLQQTFGLSKLVLSDAQPSFMNLK